MSNKIKVSTNVCLAGVAICVWVAVAEAAQPDFFAVGDHQAFILRPSQVAAESEATPWVWYAPTIVGTNPNGSNEWLFQQLLDSGIAVAGIDVGESYGSPAGRAAFSEFYTYATSHGLASKVCFLGQSRGGLMVYNWAAENADKITAIAGIYPVCDLSSYPGLETAAPVYGMTGQELEEHLADHNPIDRLKPLADANIPILHIHGDSDNVVPLLENSQVLFDRYTALGGRMEMVVVPGKGHEEVSEFFQSPQLLDFLETHAVVPEPGTAGLLSVAVACGLLACVRRGALAMPRRMPRLPKWTAKKAVGQSCIADGRGLQ